MKHIRNTETHGRYKDHTGQEVTGPKLLPREFFKKHTTDFLVGTKTLAQVEAMQGGKLTRK